ncbi:hypothetical protein H2200_008857 [Cladophialophora chaetospira]|uniref:DUF6594 domain-containing protein n=1 Tax=Cladophialophora chaetospira TaxID=386627 RepID=A0AA39CG43_9EURO|nr:hypothetical protein H2200_008857 [Cladophialophora chaetospira]
MAKLCENKTIEEDKGYGALARLMADYPENTIFRQFRALCSRMLMYRQVELLYDESELRLMTQWNELDPERARCNHSWKEMGNNPGAVMFRDKVDQVQTKLRSYYEMLMLAGAVEKLPNPNTLSLAFLQDWVKHRDRGNDFLLDIESQAWDASHGDDYVVLSPKASHDSLAVALVGLIVPIYHRMIGTHRSPAAKTGHGKIWHYGFERFVLLGNILCILLATGIPSGSIVILYVVSSMLLRLLIIAIFCFLFACTMTFIVGARRVDVFSATAAFAAVQAVFVGGTTLVQTTS